MSIVVAEPFGSDAADEAGRAENFAVLNQATLALVRQGHAPVIGVSLALPMIAAAGRDDMRKPCCRLR